MKILVFLWVIGAVDASVRIRARFGQNGNSSIGSKRSRSEFEWGFIPDENRQFRSRYHYVEESDGGLVDLSGHDVPSDTMTGLDPVFSNEVDVTNEMPGIRPDAFDDMSTGERESAGSLSFSFDDGQTELGLEDGRLRTFGWEYYSDEEGDDRFPEMDVEDPFGWLEDNPFKMDVVEFLWPAGFPGLP